MASPGVEDPPVHSIEQELLDKTASLTVQGQEQDQKTSDLAPHRSHDPQNNMKRSDPFQFGSRYLQENDDVFEFNAWDHVETDDTYKEYAEQQFQMQRESPVSDFDRSKFLLFPSSLTSSHWLL
jgi:tRNAThr (cytosine32-N3)-methyltransferase